ncbi:MAG: dihydropteroate synthase [Acidimicrobiales bacterium]
MVTAGSNNVVLELGPTPFDITHRALVMGILNRTPDSFYDAGQYWDFDDFLRKADLLVDDGADFLDVGGVKAAPGEEVDVDEELQRVVPAVEALVDRYDLPISVDTWNPVVLEECLKSGAVIANDISGFEDPRYLEVASAHDATVIATHIRIGPRVPDPEPHYDDLVGEVRSFLADRAQMALDAGIQRQRIIIDAGMDLGKNRYMSWELLDRSQELADLGYPLLLSASNKRFLFELLETERHNINEGSMACHALGIAKGCRILRAHDVRASRRVADVMAELLTRRAELDAA